MTDKQEQALATSEEQQNAAPELEQAAAQEQQAKELSPAEQLRNAMGHNFLQHCINSRVAECEQAGANPLVVGSTDAIAIIIGQAINTAGPEGIEQQLTAVMQAISMLAVNGVPLGAHVARGIIAQAAEQGAAFALLGELQGHAVNVAMQAAMNGVYSAVMEKVGPAVEVAPNPMKPFPENAEAAPAVDHEQHIEEAVAEAIAKDEAGNANYTSAEEAKQVMDNRKRIARQKPRNANKRRPRNR